jgi:hypothetical protein
MNPAKSLTLSPSAGRPPWAVLSSPLYSPLPHTLSFAFSTRSKRPNLALRLQRFSTGFPSTEQTSPTGLSWSAPSPVHLSSSMWTPVGVCRASALVGSIHWQWGSLRRWSLLALRPAYDVWCTLGLVTWWSVEVGIFAMLMSLLLTLIRFSYFLVTLYTTCLQNWKAAEQCSCLNLSQSPISLFELEPDMI